MNSDIPVAGELLNQSTIQSFGYLGYVVYGAESVGEATNEDEAVLFIY